MAIVRVYSRLINLKDTAPTCKEHASSISNFNISDGAIAYNLREHAPVRVYVRRELHETSAFFCVSYPCDSSNFNIDMTSAIVAAVRMGHRAFTFLSHAKVWV